MSRAIAERITEWVIGANGFEDRGELVVSDWSRMSIWGTITVLRETNERVMPLRLNEDGSLVVRVMDTYEERTLVADYLL